MEKFEIITERDDVIEFVLPIDKSLNLGVIFYISTNKNDYKWYYLAGIKSWNPFELQKKIFIMSKKGGCESLSDEVKQKINDGFYELLRQLKNDPAYRLKIINMLDDETREIWKVV